MNGEVIKSFLVSLGFGVDEGSMKKFFGGIASAGVKVAALYGSINLMTAAVVKGFSKVSEGFEQMGYEYRIIAPAINKALVLRRELLNAYAAAGVNITKVIRQSIQLNMSLARTRIAFKAIYESVAARFFPLLTKQSDLFRKTLYANLPKIQNALEKVIKFIFKAFEATVTLGTRLWSMLTRVYDFFVRLDKATDGWSTLVIGLVAAWKLLNLEFLATPLGMIIAGLVAILALFDDFKTWEEGGTSLFDWSSFVPVIDAVTETVKLLYAALDDIAQVLGNIILAMYQAFKGDWTGVVDSLKAAFQSLLDTIMHLWTALGGVGVAVGSLGEWAMKLFGGSNAAANIQNNPVGRPTTSPVGGASLAGPQTNQNVTQQTQISISGVSDPHAAAGAVTAQQSRVNFDLTRNLKGATR